MRQRLLQIFDHRRDPTRQIDLTVVTAIAAWMIFNSHTEAFHPFRWMAADGLLGNSLFFFISGYGIQASLSKSRQTFLAYFARRLIRIYISLLIVELAFSFITPNFQYFDYSALQKFIYPTSHTYVVLIIPFYIVLWFVDRAATRWYWISIFFSAVVLGFYYYDYLDIVQHQQHLSLGNIPFPLWLSFYWILVALGALSARAEIASNLSLRKIYLLFAVLLTYFILKLLMVTYGLWTDYYPVLLILVVILCWLGAVTLSSPLWVDRVMSIPIIGPFLAFSSAATFEIYIIHEPLTTYARLYNLPYPGNIAVLAALTVVLAIVVHMLSSRIQRKLRSVIAHLEGSQPATLPNEAPTVALASSDKRWMSNAQGLRKL
jgi:peptidoglycan/LPS O-acetylase OafA/YrhL